MDENAYLIGIRKSYAGYGGKTGTTVIPSWKILEFIQKARERMQR